MKIRVLAENTSASEPLGSEHGLSLYIEALKHKILFDAGASTLFADNAAKMGVNLAQVDLAFLSHGHYDHGGGLRKFLELNSAAKIYAHEKAFGEFYAARPDGKMAYIGLDRALRCNERFLLTGDRLVIEDGIELFSDVKGENLSPSGNASLLRKDGESFVRDEFAHEQNLILEEEGKMLLLAGCAHRGIINVMEKLRTLKGRQPDVVIGGFHLYNPGTKKSESSGVVDAVAAYLMSTGAKFYTCHCTGMEAYERLKARMNDRIHYISTGAELTV